MLLEGIVGLGVIGGIALSLTRESKEDRLIKRDILELWHKLIEGLGRSAENSIKQDYELDEIFIKAYGFDAQVMIPYGQSLKKFRDLIPCIESTFNAEVIAEHSKNKSCIYMRVHILNVKDYNPKDDIRFKWFNTFNEFNSSGETFRIDKIEDILNPNLSKEEYNKQIVGYKLTVFIPEGLDYDKLLKYEVALNNRFGKAFIYWNHNNNKAIVDIITKQLDNKEKFRVLECKPWELFCAMTHSYKPIILDFKVSQGAIFGGQNGSGKTVSEITPFINLATQYTRDDFRMYIGSTSDKQDLRILTKLDMCDYYAKDITENLKMMRYLINENKRRNQLFENCSKYTTNIFDYNKNNPNNKLPFLYFITDEIADYMEESHDSDNVKSQKKEFQSLFWKLARTGRSGGVWIVASSQRGDTKNLEANTKSQFGNKICYYQPNISSAQTIFGQGDNMATRVTKLVKANRECLVEYSEGITIAKSLYLTNEMMEELVRPHIVKDKKYLNLSNKGHIIEDKIEEISQKTLEIKQNEVKIEQKQSKINENKQKNNKNLVNVIKNFKDR